MQVACSDSVLLGEGPEASLGPRGLVPVPAKDLSVLWGPEYVSVVVW